MGANECESKRWNDCIEVSDIYIYTLPMYVYMYICLDVYMYLIRALCKRVNKFEWKF